METTGLNPQTDKIIEVAGIYVARGLIVGDFDYLVNPMRVVPRYITELTGITNSMVMNEPTIYDIYARLRRKLGNTMLVGYNIDGFDKKFLDAVSIEIDGVPLYNKTFDVLPVMRNKFPGVSHKLTNMCAMFDIHYNAHRAKDDCIALYNLMKICGLLS